MNITKDSIMKVSDYIGLMRDKSIEEMVFDSPHSTRNEKCFPIIAKRDFTITIDFNDEECFYSKDNPYEQRIAGIYNSIKHYHNVKACNIHPGKITLNIKYGDIGGWMDEDAYYLNCDRFVTDENDLFWIFPNSFIFGSVRIDNSIIGDPAVIQLLQVHPKYKNVNLPSAFIASTYKDGHGSQKSRYSISNSIISNSTINGNYYEVDIIRAIITNNTKIVGNDRVNIHKVCLNDCRLYDRQDIRIIPKDLRGAMHIISKVYCNENETEHDVYEYKNDPFYKFNNNHLNIYTSGSSMIYNIAVTGSLAIKGRDILLRNVGFDNKKLVEIPGNTQLYNTIISSQDDFFVINNEATCTIDYVSQHILTTYSDAEYTISDLYDNEKQEMLVTSFCKVDIEASLKDRTDLYINRLRNINEVISKTRAVNNDVNLDTVIDLGRYSEWSIKKGFSDNYDDTLDDEFES